MLHSCPKQCVACKIIYRLRDFLNKGIYVSEYEETKIVRFFFIKKIKMQLQVNLSEKLPEVTQDYIYLGLYFNENLSWVMCTRNNSKEMKISISTPNYMQININIKMIEK